VQGRIGKRMRLHGFTGYDQYLKLLASDETGEELVHFLDAIATNVTHFFREKEPFEFLALRLAEWKKAGQDRFRRPTACSMARLLVAITCMEPRLAPT
jgi:chemotaxis protein methyltransferase CheR